MSDQEFRLRDPLGQYTPLMSQIKVVPLGAGQDVGRSCIIVSLGGKNIMFDCGMHMGYNDERRFPNFKYLSPEGNFDQVIDVVIISHFHLDHCGALPYFTEMCGYNGPVIMTYPTKAVCPILLEDFRKITVERKGETHFFTSNMIKDCMKKVIGVNIHQTVKIGEDIEVKAYYAGHVLGAAMFYVKVGNEHSCLYTGDYNMTPDRHLGAAQIDKLKVDLLITETTYATTIRDSKRLRERDFLDKVHEAVERGGKVLIPVFALGRAQELCILVETYWERMGLGHVPVYFSAGLVEKANLYYKLFINWTNQKIKDTFVKHNMFDFKHIKPYDRLYADKPGPMVLFATPGMLHAGMSLEVFKKWCGNELNMCILPGYCVAGTVGNKILSGSKRVEIDKKTTVDVRLQVRSLSFSAHADAKGIMQLIQQCEPKNVMLCHGEKGKMQFLKERIKTEFGIPCYDPANGEVLTINLAPPVPVDISTLFLKPHLTLKRPRMDSPSLESSSKSFESSSNQSHPMESSNQLNSSSKDSSMLDSHHESLLLQAPQPKRFRVDDKLEIEGILIVESINNSPTTSSSSTDNGSPTSTTPSSKGTKIRLIHPREAQKTLGIPEHEICFEVEKQLPVLIQPDHLWKAIGTRLTDLSLLKSSKEADTYDVMAWHSIKVQFKSRMMPVSVLITWNYHDDDEAEWILKNLDTVSMLAQKLA